MTGTSFLCHLSSFPSPHSLFVCITSLHCLSTSVPDSLITAGPLTQFIYHLPTVFISFSLSNPGANEFWMWSVWGPKLLPSCRLSSWVLPQCTKCLSWILNKPQDLLRASWSTALLLLSYYSARGPWALAGWMGFESVVLWAKVEIIGMGGLSVWSCLILSVVIMKPFLSVL